VTKILAAIAMHKTIILSFACVVSAVLFALPALAQASTFQAVDVLGQTSGPNISFTSNAHDNGTTTNAGGLSYPYGLALDTVNHRLFVSDNGNDRVLEYDLDTNDHIISHTADHILGQPDFVSNQSNQGGTASSTTMSAPEGLTYDPTGNRLFVADSVNDRVLVFNLSGGITNDMPASYVLGQPDFISHLRIKVARQALRQKITVPFHERLIAPRGDA
jgi:DNA-binding beta-propeller fold protein YncE